MICVMILIVFPSLPVFDLVLPGALGRQGENERSRGSGGGSCLKIKRFAGRQDVMFRRVLMYVLVNFETWALSRVPGSYLLSRIKAYPLWGGRVASVRRFQIRGISGPSPFQGEAK